MVALYNARGNRFSVVIEEFEPFPNMGDIV